MLEPPPAMPPWSRARPVHRSVTDPVLWLWCTAWAVNGALYFLSLLAILTIGVFVAPLAMVLTVVLVVRPGPRAAAGGLVSGISLPCFWVAYLNRGGPGNVCSSVGAGISCTQEWSPKPFIIVGVVCLLLGVWIVASWNNRQRRRDLLGPNAR